MENFSFNLKEHFQDNSVDYSEASNGTGNVSLNSLATLGNSNFNHKEPSLWKYLGVHNLSSNQIDCTFDCVQEGLDCSGECGSFDKKCENNCTGESFKCVKSCLEKKEDTVTTTASKNSHNEDEEDKSTRLNKDKFEPRYYDGVSDVYAAFMPSESNSFTIKTNPGVYGKMAEKVLDDQARAKGLHQYSKEMRVKFS
jgi:hypothetical protein